MACLTDINATNIDNLKFGENINFPATPSTAFPPNMLEIMALISGPKGVEGAFNPSPNLVLIDQIENKLAAARAYWDALPDTPRRTKALRLFDGNYGFRNDVRFNPYTQRYDVSFPPLLSNTGGIQDILDIARTHINGVPDTLQGALGSLGAVNRFRTFGFIAAGNNIKKHLGEKAIPDCGLVDELMGLLQDVLQPLLDIIDALLDSVNAIVQQLLAIIKAIQDELNKILDVIQELLDFLNANILLSLDPCVLYHMAKTGTFDLNTAVNEGIIWRGPNLPTIPGF